MLKIGLTGGIGSGKSTVSNLFKENSIEVIDADIVAREVLVKYPEILEKIRVQFGEGFFDWRGEFRRKEFGNHIFRFPKFRIKYEEIILPFIKKEIFENIEKLSKNKEKIVVVDAPTLVETGLYKEMDYVILVAVENTTQVKRIRSRDALGGNDIANRINSQMPLEKKKEFANIIIDNNRDLSYTKEQVLDIISFLKEIV